MQLLEGDPDSEKSSGAGKLVSTILTHSWGTFLNLEAVPTFMQKGLLDLAPGILGVAVA